MLEIMFVVTKRYVIKSYREDCFLSKKKTLDLSTHF